MNEVTIAVSLGINKSGVASSLSRTLQRDLSGSNQISQVQTIGTSKELLVIGDLGNVAHIALSNIGETNSIAISLDNAGVNVICTLAPGAVAYLPATSSTLYAATDAGSSDLAVVACED